jgi:hypothetical protein
MGEQMSRTLRIVTALAVVAVVLSSCYPFQGVTVRTAASPDIIGSRKLIDKTFDLTGFTAVETRNGVRAQISKGDTTSVVITVDDNVADHVDVQKVDNRLIIGLKDGSYKNITLKAAITMPELTGATATGGSQLSFKPFTTTSGLTFNSSGGASITGEIEGADTTVTASAGADVTLKGKGAKLVLNHSGGGTVKLGGFAANDAAVLVTGGSDSEINASGAVTGSVSGGGKLKVSGPATVSVATSGGGKVTN